MLSLIVVIAGSIASADTLSFKTCTDLLKLKRPISWKVKQMSITTKPDGSTDDRLSRFSTFSVRLEEPGEGAGSSLVVQVCVLAPELVCKRITPDGTRPRLRRSNTLTVMKFHKSCEKGRLENDIGIYEKKTVRKQNALTRSRGLKSASLKKGLITISVTNGLK